MAGEWPEQAQVQRYGASRPPICEDVVALAGYQDSSTNPTGGPFRRRCLLSRSSACNLVLKESVLWRPQVVLWLPQQIPLTTAIHPVLPQSYRLAASVMAPGARPAPGSSADSPPTQS